MGVFDKLKDAIPPLLPRGGYDPWGGDFVLYESGACNFEVCDRGTWYKIDANHLALCYYEDVPVPEFVLVRAREALNPFLHSPECCAKIDPTPYYQELLSEEFDEARFINMTYKPGVVY